MSLSLLESARTRSQHFSTAISWYTKSLADASLQGELFMELVGDLVACSREKGEHQVFLFAVGKSAHVATLAVAMFASVGILARFVHATEAFHGDLGVVGKNDVAILISNNGGSQEVLQLIPGLQERGAKLYALTSKERSPLAQSVSKALLLPPVDEMCPLSQAPITSTITTLALCQLLVAATIEERNYSVKEYARNHPGGAIGRRIFLKVDDVMSQGENLPQVDAHTVFTDVVGAFTRFAKAGVLVVQGGKMQGLIAEKDLRVAMETHGPQAFVLTAASLMNPHPTTIEPGMLAIDALRMMTDHNPPFNLLPVVDAENNAVGLVHIQDILGAGVSLG